MSTTRSIIFALLLMAFVSGCRVVYAKPEKKDDQQILVESFVGLDSLKEDHMKFCGALLDDVHPMIEQNVWAEMVWDTPFDGNSEWWRKVYKSSSRYIHDNCGGMFFPDSLAYGTKRFETFKRAKLTGFALGG